MIRMFWIALFALAASCVRPVAHADEEPRRDITIAPCEAVSLTFINHRTGTARVCIGEPGELWSLSPGYFMRSFSEAGCFVHPPPGALVDVNDQIRVGHDYAFVFDSRRIGCRVRPMFVLYFPVAMR